MDDSRIVELFFHRDEQAIRETDRKYGSFCYSIAYTILADQQDSEESVSDTYYAAWNAIPPRRPNPLAPFLGKIVRHISIDRWRKNGALKRGGGELPLALEELQDCISGQDDVEALAEQRALIRMVRSFVQELPEPERRVFVCRYWYLDSVRDIAFRFGFTENKVNMMLHRIREKLKKRLLSEVQE